MNKEFIPYEQALELKELGFDEPCLAGYDGTELKSIYKQFMSHEPHIPAPIYQQAFRFFREKYGLDSCVYRVQDKLPPKYKWEVYSDYTHVWGYVDYQYEEAELACLKKLIEIVKLK